MRDGDCSDRLLNVTAQCRRPRHARVRFRRIRHRLAKTDDDVDRRAQFVTDIRRKFRFDAPRLFRHALRFDQAHSSFFQSGRTRLPTS